MKILVTGSSGFIGFHLVKKLIEDDHIVTGIDNHNDYYDSRLKEKRLKLLAHKNFSFHKCDLDKISSINGDFDIAINLAAQAGVRVKKEKEYLYEVSNIKGFESFCNFCKEKGISKVIYASSSSVYSDQEKNEFSETHTALEPKSLYGKSKLANEKLANEISKKYKISFIGLRFFSVYGPYGRPDMAYYLFANNIAKNKENILFNRGNMARDMTYISDIIEGINSSINYLNQTENITINEIFNLGNNTPIKTSHLLQSIEKNLFKKSKIRNQDSINESLHTHANIEKAKKLLGYSPKVKFEDGIKEFINWYKKYENS